MVHTTMKTSTLYGETSRMLKLTVCWTVHTSPSQALGSVSNRNRRVEVHSWRHAVH